MPFYQFASGLWGEVSHYRNNFRFSKEKLFIIIQLLVFFGSIIRFQFNFMKYVESPFWNRCILFMDHYFFFITVISWYTCNFQAFYYVVIQYFSFKYWLFYQKSSILDLIFSIWYWLFRRYYLDFKFGLLIYFLPTVL